MNYLSDQNKKANSYGAINNNFADINKNLEQIKQGNAEIHDILSCQTEKIDRISRGADTLGKDINDANSKAKKILYKLDGRVIPLYFCIVAEFIIILILIFLFSKSVYCLITN